MSEIVKWNLNDLKIIRDFDGNTNKLYRIKEECWCPDGGFILGVSWLH